MSVQLSSTARNLEGMPLSKTPVLGIFGGSFDPIHQGHLTLAKAVVENGFASEILFVPARKPPHKLTRDLTEPAHRLEMLRLALEPFPEFSYSDIELTRTEGFSYTIDTMGVLTRVMPDQQLKFLMGMDSLADLHQWHRSTELVQHYQFLVYPRPGISPPSFAELAGRFGSRNAKKLRASIMEDLETSECSSSELRDQLRAGADVTDMCPEHVVQYIMANQLYGTRK